MSRIKMRLFTVLLLVFVAASALFIGQVVSSQAAMVCKWCKAPVTQTYGHNSEHGVDLATRGMIITARLEGWVTFDQTECWGSGKSRECVQDITWRLRHPWLARGFSYMYVQIRPGSTFVHRGQFMQAGQALGYSDYFIEFGLTKSDAYGVHGDWSADWTTDPRFLL